MAPAAGAINTPGLDPQSHPPPPLLSLSLSGLARGAARVAALPALRDLVPPPPPPPHPLPLLPPPMSPPRMRR